MASSSRFTPVRLALASAVAAAFVSGPTLAQGAGAIEEVFVTATKRQATLQEIPIAVSVVTSESIEQAQVLDIKDLQTLVPSLRVSQLQGSAQTDFIIRGFGNGSNNPGIEPSVGVFIDGVYRSRVGSALADLPKLERVEVLRGPQSTLFGKNASAGVISVVTAKPDLLGYSGSVGATIGNYDQTIIRGDVTGPLSDNVAFSLFGSVNERDGYFTNLETGSGLNELNRWNFRGQLLWNPTDRMEVRIIADGEEIDEACCGVANVVDGPTGNIIRLLGGNFVAEDPFSYENFYDFDPSNEIKTRGTSLHVDYDFDNFTLTSITAFRTLDQLSSGDIDFTSARLIRPDAADIRDVQIDTFTQEFRLTSATDGPLQWMVGAFYFNEEVDQNETILLGPDFRPYVDTLLPALGFPPGFLAFLEGQVGVPVGTFYADGVGNVSEAYTLDDETLSLFAQIDFDLTDAMTLTLGANYTESEKQASVNVVNNNLFGQLPLAALGLPPAAAGAQFLPGTVGLPNSVEQDTTNDDDVTYTVRLAYDVTPNMNVYAGVSTGFKASSWNLSQDSGPLPADVARLIAAGDPALPNVGFGPGIANYPIGTRFAGPEEATVYEIGLKGEWDTVAVNLAIFDQEIEGFQQNAFVGTGFVLTNAGSQSTEGVELDLNWAPLDGLRVGFAVTWLDPVFDEFVGGLGLITPEFPRGEPTDLSGQRPAGIPEWATNTNVTYNFEIAGISAYIRGEHIYESEVQTIQLVPKEQVSREVNTLNVSAGLSFTNGIDLNFWARNVNNDEYLTTIFPGVAQDFTITGYPVQPRTYGLTLKYSFE